MTMTLFDPRARASDPPTSHIAAHATASSRAARVIAIRAVVNQASHPLTQFEIAERVEVDQPDRWDPGTIRTACSYSGLLCVDMKGVSPRGSKCGRYVIGRGL